MGSTIFVNLSIEDAEGKINNAVVNSSITGEVIDRYEISGPDNLKCLVIVYEKHYYRAGNRLTLTVTIDNLNGKTRVHYIGGGGGQGLFKFDWGAAESFGDVVPDSLKDNITR